MTITNNNSYVQKQSLQEELTSFQQKAATLDQKTFNAQLGSISSRINSLKSQILILDESSINDLENLSKECGRIQENKNLEMAHATFDPITASLPSSLEELYFYCEQVKNQPVTSVITNKLITLFNALSTQQQHKLLKNEEANILSVVDAIKKAFPNITSFMPNQTFSKEWQRSKISYFMQCTTLPTQEDLFLLSNELKSLSMRIVKMHEQKEEIPSQALDCLEAISNLNNLLSFVKNNREKDILNLSKNPTTVAQAIEADIKGQIEDIEKQRASQTIVWTDETKKNWAKEHLLDEPYRLLSTIQQLNGPSSLIHPALADLYLSMQEIHLKKLSEKDLEKAVKDAIKECHLPKELLKTICGKYIEFSKDPWKGDHNWGQENAWRDLGRFIEAIKASLPPSFTIEKMTYEQILNLLLNPTNDTQEQIKALVHKYNKYEEKNPLNPIFGKIYEFSKDSWKGGDGWGKWHAADDAAVLLRAFQEHFKTQSPSAWNSLSEKVADRLLNKNLNNPASFFNEISASLPEGGDNLLKSVLAFPESATKMGQIKQKLPPLDTKGFFQLKNIEVQTTLLDLKEKLKKQFGEEIALKVIRHSPDITAFKKGSLGLNSIDSIETNLKLRAEVLQRLEAAKTALCQEFPQFKEQCTQNKGTLYKLWAAKETLLLTSPYEKEPLELFLKICEKIVADYEEREALPLLEMSLKFTSSRVRFDTVEDFFSLKDIEKQAQIQTRPSGINRSTYSTYQAIYEIKKDGKTIGKYKPIAPLAAYREKLAFDYDHMLGFGMTVPTITSRLSLRAEIQRAAKSFERDNYIEAWKIFDSLSDEIKGGIYSAAFDHLHTKVGEDGIGYNLFHAGTLSNKQRAIIIEKYLTSLAYFDLQAKSDMDKQHDQGSIQPWLDWGATRALDLITTRDDGGEKLKNIPKSYAQLYATLGLIKGAIDCSSGNTFFKIDNNAISKVADFDDEKSFPNYHHYEQVRIWQMGLPQCNQSIDPVVAMLLSNKKLISQKITSYNRFSPPEKGMNKEVYDSLYYRLDRITSICQQQLDQPHDTKTPRDLFFAIYPDSKEMFNQKKHRDGMSDVANFDFGFNKIAAGNYYGGNLSIRDKNLQILNS